MMEGFGVHTFRLVNADAGDRAGQVPLEAAARRALPDLGGGADRRRRRPRLPPPRPGYDAIEAGAFPEWELGVQVFPDTPDADVRGHRPARPDEDRARRSSRRCSRSASWCSTRNPTNFFAETEQVAFHTGHLVPGIEFTNDPLLQGRNFSYLDTQLTRLGGPNLPQIPINRPHAPVNDNHRDGFMQQAHPRRATRPYLPNSVDGGGPCPPDWADGGYVNVPRHVEGDVVRASPASFDDHFSPGGDVLRQPLRAVRRCTSPRPTPSSSARCYEQAIKERALTVLAKIDDRAVREGRRRARAAGAEAGRRSSHRGPSPALRQVTGDAVPDRTGAMSASSPGRTPTSPASPRCARRSRPRARSCR